MKKVLLAGLAIGMMLGAAGIASANLVTNGDFSAGGASWTLTGNTGYSSFPDLWSDGAIGSDAYLSQTIATVAGHLYDVSFDTGIDWGRIEARLDGTTFITATTSGHFDTTVTAAINNSMLTFVTRNDPSFNQLDNVVVTDMGAPVPEPATMLLFGTGIAGLAAVGRRKRS